MTSRLGTDGKIFNLFLQCTPPLLSLSMHCILILSVQGLKPSLYLPPFPITYCTFHHLLSFTISAFHYTFRFQLSSILHFCLPSSILRLPLPSTVLYLHLVLSSAFHYYFPFTIPLSSIFSAFPFFPLSCTLPLPFTTLRLPLPSIYYCPWSSTILRLSLSSAFSLLLSSTILASTILGLSLSSVFHHLKAFTRPVLSTIPPSTNLHSFLYSVCHRPSDFTILYPFPPFFHNFPLPLISTFI